MQLQLTAVLNRGLSSGKVLNALAHMCLGSGHLVDRAPNIYVCFGNTASVRQFRDMAARKVQAQITQSAFSDFPHTMHGGDTEQSLELSRQTHERDIQYYGACFLGTSLDSSMAELISSCTTLTDYQAYKNSVSAQLLPKLPHQDADKPSDKKIVLLFNNKIPLSQSINAAILSALEVGKRVPYADLRLLEVMDKDGNRHTNISYHPFPVLKTDNSNNHNLMIDTIARHNSLISNTQRDGYGRPLATVIFGARTEVEAVVSRKLTRLYNHDFKDSEFKPQAVSTGEEITKPFF